MCGVCPESVTVGLGGCVALLPLVTLFIKVMTIISYASRLTDSGDDRAAKLEVAIAGASFTNVPAHTACTKCDAAFTGNSTVNICNIHSNRILDSVSGLRFSLASNR